MQKPESFKWFGRPKTAKPTQKNPAHEGPDPELHLTSLKFFRLRVGRLGAAVIFDVGFGGFSGVMRCVLVMTMGQVGMMCCGLVLH
jgi:hypothetical protein